MENKKYQGFIRGKTLELRPMIKDHIEIYRKWANDRRNRRLMRIEMPRTLEESMEWLQSDERKENIRFEVWYTPNNKLIGNSGLIRIDWRNRTASLGLRIGEVDYWNKGVGSEASELIMKYGFEELNLHKITAEIYEPNIGSQKCALKIGMNLENTMKETIFIDGKYSNTYFYTMFEREWFSLHPIEHS